MNQKKDTISAGGSTARAGVSVAAWVVSSGDLPLSPFGMEENKMVVVVEVMERKRERERERKPEPDVRKNIL